MSQVAPAGSRELARSFCALWWRQVLAGRLFPLDLGAEDVRVLPEGRIAFQGTAFARSTTALPPDLGEALVAVVSRDPDAACTALLREMVRGRREIRGGATVAPAPDRALPGRLLDPQR